MLTGSRDPNLPSGYDSTRNMENTADGLVEMQRRRISEINEEAADGVGGVADSPSPRTGAIGGVWLWRSGGGGAFFRCVCGL